MAPNILTPIRNLQTIGFHGHNVKFSPLSENLIAVASGENFGIKGSGSLQIFDASLPGNPAIRKFSWSDVLLDVSWTTIAPDVALTCSGDGTIQIWDFKNPRAPTQVIHAHTQEVSSLQWTKDKVKPMFLTTSWDGQLNLWDINHSHPITNFNAHPNIVYEAVWSPSSSDLIATASGDGTATLWTPLQSPSPVLTLPNHNAEVLSCEFSYFDPNLLITAATDSTLRGWDPRNSKTSLFLLACHQKPVRKVRCSPFHSEELATVSYDFTTRLWDLSTAACCVAVSNFHSEFVYGLDYSTASEGLLADCSWDQYVTLYRALERPRQQPWL